MPTETEPSLPPSPPRIDARSRSSTRASCPPDEERETRALGEERIEDVARQSVSDEGPRTAMDEPTFAQLPTPGPEEDTFGDSTSRLMGTSAEAQGKQADAATAESRMALEIPSPVVSLSSATGADGELRNASATHQVSTPSPLSAPRYLSFGGDDERKLHNSTTSFLRPGSKFQGTQQSDRQVYEVQVELKDVNMAESFLCGYLRIKGLTDDHPTLTTFFEGEIIGPKHLFRTTHPAWGSSEKTDMQHWGRFPAWRPLAKAAKQPNFTLKNPFAREHIFMRWKEYFLVPDHKVKTIMGASFEGFYYICFDQAEGKVSGIYFHAKSEKYQQLELKHVDDRGCMPAVEFR
ncbi:hypothetical protein K431DRAFT_43485 [Polychaeton citri CBS 116435]|uniref:Vesicle-mediated transport protein Vid24 n=1 Tax=Polychaeton citri CBS 116435 TaxID=1314669 RepID=A0A9P4QD88_9PEZI|nr:hypothetical protein K431DRAFT_43485 [Polychaeton citri CBS 116435]